jgi:tetratricopeptide (TPR) repeat protein
MKRRLLNLLVCGLAAGAIGAPLEVVIKISRGTLAGVFEERGQGFVIFRLKEGTNKARINDNQLVSVTFKPGVDLAPVKRKFDSGAYQEVADTYSQVLPPFQPYIGLPSNLSDEFPRWMVASYWAGDYSRTIELAEALIPVSGETFRETADFYSWLARMEMGEFEAMAAFMKTAQAATLYPEHSAVRLYIQARLLKHEGRPLEAIRTTTRLIARHGHDGDWMPQAELFCAELYFELDMPKSAEAVLADIGEFYSNEAIKNKAAALAAKQKVHGEIK